MLSHLHMKSKEPVAFLAACLHGIYKGIQHCYSAPMDLKVAVVLLISYGFVLRVSTEVNMKVPMKNGEGTAELRLALHRHIKRYMRRW